MDGWTDGWTDGWAEYQCVFSCLELTNTAQVTARSHEDTHNAQVVYLGLLDYTKQVYYIWCQCMAHDRTSY